MTSDKWKENGEHPRLLPVLPPDGDSETRMNTTVSMTALTNEQHAQFDAVVEDLLAHLVQREVEHERA